MSRIDVAAPVLPGGQGLLFLALLVIGAAILAYRELRKRK